MISETQLSNYINGVPAKISAVQEMATELLRLQRENQVLAEALKWALPFALRAADPSRSCDDVPSLDWQKKKAAAKAALAQYASTTTQHNR